MFAAEPRVYGRGAYECDDCGDITYAERKFEPKHQRDEDDRRHTKART